MIDALYSAATIVVWSLSIVLVLIVSYLGCLALAAFANRRLPPEPDGRNRRFAILVPAHNEEALIGRLLNNIAQIEYPSTHIDVCVVADNCDDSTAAIARSHGARVYERRSDTERSKGFALRWLLEHLAQESRTYDAFIVIDADSVVAPNFLARMNARLAAGSQVVQAYYSVLNADDSPLAGIRYAALASLHFLRPAGRLALRLSCGLKGNGMCFSAPIMDRFAWNWFTLAEDVEFHLALVREGVRVDFAPETWVLADMPVTFAQAASQNQRWERGRLQLVRQYVPGLLRRGIRARSALLIDAAVEQLIPPISVPLALGAVCVAMCVPLGLVWPGVLAAVSIVMHAALFVAALALVRAPARAYLSLVYAPVYVVWKLGVYSQVLLAPRTRAWIRTARLPAQPS